MGQAKNRGSFEERRKQAHLREQGKLWIIQEAKLLRQKQEVRAIQTMTWWQLDMSIERYERISRKKTNTQMQLAQIMGMLYYPTLYR